MDPILRQALRKSRELRNQLENLLLGDDGDEVERQLRNFVAKRPCWVTTVTTATTIANPYLKSIATGRLAKTTGQRSLAQAGKTFTGGLDSDFANWKTDVKGEPTKETPFEVLEQVTDGTFRQIFEAFGVELDKLCWSQDQIISFVENHADKLHPQGYATFFLFKVGNEFFVANARRRGDGQLKAFVYRLSLDNVWRAEDRDRLVVPQLSL